MCNHFPWFLRGAFFDLGAYLEGPKTTPWHGTVNKKANAAAGARFATTGSAEMRPALQREHDSERA
eukprot:4771429-Pyramimonas_sp.AAC.1